MVRKLVFSFIALVLFGNDNRSFLVPFLKINRLRFHFFLAVHFPYQYEILTNMANVNTYSYSWYKQ